MPQWPSWPDASTMLAEVPSLRGGHQCLHRAGTHITRTDWRHTVIELTRESLAYADVGTIQLLVDAGWIKVTREWYREQPGYWMVRHRENRKFRRLEDRTWNFPCSVWKNTASAPCPGGKRLGMFVTEIDNEWGMEHLVEFKILKWEHLR